MNILSKQILGSDIIELLLNIHHPMMMVDTIKSFDSRTRSLESIKMISSNEPVFQGHFPGLKLWPGIHTIEGLKQSILLYLALKKLEDENMFKKTIGLQRKMRNIAQLFSDDNHGVLKYIKENFPQEAFLYTFRIKLVTPVFSESVMHYSVFQQTENKLDFDVTAFVNTKIVAKGEILLN